MGKFKWLHFSDLHFALDNNYDTKESRQELLDYLKKRNFECDYVFITGDIANKCDFSGAKEFIQELLAILNIQDANNQVFWAAGNHDISREMPYKNDIIQEIRSEQDGALSSAKFQTKMATKSYRNILTHMGMQDYIEQYAEIFNREMTLSEIYNAHNIYVLENCNVIVLNTSLTSMDNKDAYNLYITETLLSESIKKIDRNKPTIAIGHHGKDFFEPSFEQVRISHIFDDSVDLYLCGHSHRLGYDVFCDSEYDVHQFTCGGGLQDGYSVFSFMYGEYDDEKKNIVVTPYSYSSGGARNWRIGNLHRRLQENSIFSLDRLKKSNHSLDNIFLKTKPRFDELIKDAKTSIFISSFFLSAVPESYLLKEKIIDEGIEVKLLLNKRAGECVKATSIMLDGGNVKRFNNKLNSTLYYLKNMYGNGKMPQNLVIKEIDYTFPYRITAIDAEEESGFIQVCVNSFHNVDEKQVTFTCRRNDSWFDFYIRQMNFIWQEAEEIDFDSLDI